MTPEAIDITLAISMVAVALVLVLWFEGSVAAATGKRIMRMMILNGLKPGFAMGGGARLTADLKDARKRCGRCTAEDLCDRWLVGKVQGANDFCPNAKVFRMLSEINGRAV